MSRHARYAAMWVAIAAALAGCGDSPTAPPDRAPLAAHPARAEVSRGGAQQSFSGIAQACDGEIFAITMKVNHTWQIATHDSGEWMLTQHSRFSTEGIGTISGRRYIGRGTSQTTQVFAALGEGGAFTYTSLTRLHNIVQGRADNDVVSIVAHWTINAQGQVSANRASVTSECRG